MKWRQLLQWVAVGSAGLQLPRSAWAEVELLLIPFGLCVACEQPTSDCVVLWSRSMQPALQAPNIRDISALWEVADDDKFIWITQTGQSSASPGLAYLAHSELQG